MALLLLQMHGLLRPPGLTSRTAVALHSSRHLASPVAQLGQREVVVSATLDEQKVEQLFAWISRAFEGDARYNNLMLAFAAIFGEHEPGSAYSRLVDDAMEQRPSDPAEPVGRISDRVRGCHERVAGYTHHASVQF